ncbi:MAG: hypothetical protein E7310_07255 [Clostridiales bacterium]|nr:hypothetical protein [Clostridiales bacterium]
MNLFEKLLYMLQVEMNTPKAFGWFHLMWICITIFSLLILFKLKNKYSEKQLKIVLGTYGIIALLFEVIKQLIWSFNYDSINNIVTWDYQWYAAPFQLCTTPIFVAIICLFLKNNKIRNALLSYMAFVTILGGLITIIIPDSCFVSDTLINIHTMWLHCGSFVVSVYLIMSGTVKLKKENLINAFVVFIIFVAIAEVLNIIIYNIDILNGETFNMFYISPYFVSTLPVFNVLQENLPFIIYLITYIIAVCIGATTVYGISCGVRKLKNKKTALPG